MQLLHAYARLAKMLTIYGQIDKASMLLLMTAYSYSTLSIGLASDMHIGTATEAASTASVCLPMHMSATRTMMNTTRPMRLYTAITRLVRLMRMVGHRSRLSIRSVSALNLRWKTALTAE